MNDIPDYVKQWAQKLVQHSEKIDLEKLFEGDVKEVAKVATLMGYAESAEAFYREEP